MNEVKLYGIHDFILLIELEITVHFLGITFQILMEKNLSEILNWKKKIPNFPLLKCLPVKVPTKTLNNK